MIGATAAFLLAAPHLPLANGVGVFLALTATLWAIGALLDGRISVCEALYVFAAASTCAAFALDWPLVEGAMKPLGDGALDPGLCVAPELKAPVAVYVAVIALMAGQAAGRAIVLQAGAAAAVAIGALAFMLSDMTIALAKFGNVGWPADQWTLPTYYLAQGLIVFWVLPRRQN